MFGFKAQRRLRFFASFQAVVRFCNFPPEVVLLRHQPTLTMKTTLISVLTATLLGIASFASGRPFDAADFTAILFTTGLVAWTIEQYSREPRQLTANRPIRFPVNLGGAQAKPVISRLAA